MEALNQTTAGVARYVPVTQKLCYALAAIVAIVSAVVIYKKLQDGNENAKKLIALPVLSCVFLTASATALPKFFGLDTSKEHGLGVQIAAGLGYDVGELFEQEKGYQQLAYF